MGAFVSVRLSDDTARTHTLNLKCMTSRLAIVANLTEVLEPLLFDNAMLCIDRPHDDTQLTSRDFRPIVGEKTVTLTGNPNLRSVLVRNTPCHVNMNRFQWVSLV